MTPDAKIALVQEWASTVRTSFDASFVDSLELYYSKHGALTCAQERALDNIIQRWGIHRWVARGKVGRPRWAD